MEKACQYKNYLLYAVAFLSLGLVIALLFVPSPALKSLSTGHMLFLTVLFIIPSFLFFTGARYIRGFFVIISLALFGFLQMGCPMLNGSLELILLNLSQTEDVVLFIVKTGAIIVLTLLFSRYFCGWICPQGILQDLVHQPKLRVVVPQGLDRRLKLLKYVMLVIMTLSVLVWHFRLFEVIGPFKVVFNLNGSALLIALLVFWLALSVIIERPFCRYLCPGGSLLAIIGKWSFLGIRKDAGKECRHCRQCEKTCPMGAIEVRDDGVKIHRDECIACMECRHTCPQGLLGYGISSRMQNKSSQGGNGI